jgi:large subunit ribosomal protein L13
MKTHVTKAKEIKRAWHLVDLRGQVLGRSASRMAQLLMGKAKVYFTPALDCGDFVVAVNAAEVVVTGRKNKQKIYYRHSGYPSGLKSLTFEQLLAKDPRKVIRLAVKNMLPKNKLQNKRLARLKVFPGEKHDYQDKFKKSNLPN